MGYDDYDEDDEGEEMDEEARAEFEADGAAFFQA